MQTRQFHYFLQALRKLRLRYTLAVLLAGCLPELPDELSDLWKLWLISQAKGGVAIEGEVSALYPVNGANWNDYVANDGANRFQATDTACNTTTTGGYYACIHGGLYRNVVLSKPASCSDQLSARDALGVFRWSCDDSSGKVRMVATGFQDGKYLSDLIDFATGSWRANSVTVTNGTATATTPSAVWWSNPIAVNPAGGALSASGTVYVFSSSTNSDYTIGADKIAIVGRPGVMLQGSGGASPIFSATSRNFLWFEGMWDGTNNATVGINWSGVRFSALHGVKIQRVSSNGIALATASENNLLSNLVLGEIRRGLNISTNSNFNLFHKINISSVTVDQGLYLGGSNQVAIDLAISSTAGDSINIYGGGATAKNFIANASLHHAGNQAGMELDSSGADSLMMNIASSTTEDAIASTFAGTDRVTYLNLAVVYANTWGIDQAAGSYYYYTGLLLLGNNTADCNITPANAGITATCAASNASDFSLSTGVDVSNSFVGALSTNDAANTTSQSSATSAFGSIADWLRFENRYRSWGKNNPYGSIANKSRCDAGTCQIWDWSLRSSDTQLRNRLSLPTGNETIVKYWSAASQTACQAISGAVWQDQVCSYPGYTTSTSCTAAGGTWSTGLCTSRILRNAVEIIGDGYGNENGLCESNERCLHTPNIGAYQGHGNLISAGTFTNGTLTGITLYKYATNGR